MRVALVLLLVACHPPGYGEDPSVDAGADAADGPPGPDAPPPDAAPLVTCEATFRLEGRADATSVWVTGSFTGWAGNPNDGALALTLGDDEVWTGTRTIDAGSHPYKLVIDGSEWIPDPANPDTVDDGFGGVNSVYTCP